MDLPIRRVSRKERQRAWQNYLANPTDIEAQNAVIEANLSLVGYVMKKFFSAQSNETKEDLFQEGCLGLKRALEKFDPAAGARFPTYANYWIFQKMQRYLELRNTTIRIPSHVWNVAAKIRQARRELKTQIEGPVSDEAIALHLGWRVEKVTNIRRALKALDIRSLDAIRPSFDPQSEDSDCFIPVLEAAQPDAAILIGGEVTPKELRGALAHLDPRDRKIVIAYANGLSLRQTAPLVDLSIEGVRWALARSLGKLRTLLEVKEPQAAVSPNRVKPDKGLRFTRERGNMIPQKPPVKLNTPKHSVHLSPREYQIAAALWEHLPGDIDLKQLSRELGTTINNIRLTIGKLQEKRVLTGKGLQGLSHGIAVGTTGDKRKPESIVPFDLNGLTSKEAAPVAANNMPTGNLTHPEPGTPPAVLTQEQNVPTTEQEGFFVPSFTVESDLRLALEVKIRSLQEQKQRLQTKKAELEAAEKKIDHQPQVFQAALAESG